MRKFACAKAADAISTKTPNAAAAKATHVTAAKATAHVASAKAAAHVTAAKAAHAPATVSSAATATAAAAGLCTRGKKAAGKYRGCQNHHHSSSHNILRWDGRTFRHRSLPNAGVLRRHTPTSRLTGHGNADLPPLLNSHSIIGI
jgi:hypothetical protein